MGNIQIVTVANSNSNLIKTILLQLQENYKIRNSKEKNVLFASCYSMPLIIRIMNIIKNKVYLSIVYYANNKYNK